MILNTLIKQSEYKPIVSINENRRHVYFDKVDDGEVVCTCKVFDLTGTSKDILLTKIKETILNYYNDQIDNKIISGFTWTDPDSKEHSVWLSSENQFNYKAAYDAYVTNGMPTDGFTVKFGDSYNTDYYTFTDIATLKDFYIKSLEYVQNILSEGWKTKNALDWSVYENLL